MFSIQKIFGKDKSFFDLFNKSAAQNLTGATGLIPLLANPEDPSALAQIREARTHSKEITEEIHQLVIKTFVTSLDREDVEALSSALYKVLKPIEKFVERLRITTDFVDPNSFKSQVNTIISGCKQAANLVKLVSSPTALEEARAVNAALHHTEEDADALELDLLKSLYRDSGSDCRKLVITKDLYDLLEKAIDRCRDVGNVAMHIILKNS